MAESGFTLFLAYLQERNEATKPKSRADRQQGSNPRPTIPLPVPSPLSPASIDDYTSSVCLLHKLTTMTPAYMEVLIDAEDFDRAIRHGWLIVYEGKCREPRVVHSGKPRYLHRFVTNAPKGMVVDHQFHNTLDA